MSLINKELDRVSGGVRKRDIPMREMLGDDPLGKISDWVYKINKKLTEGMSAEGTQWNI